MQILLAVVTRESSSLFLLICIYKQLLHEVWSAPENLLYQRWPYVFPVRKEWYIGLRVYVWTKTQYKAILHCEINA